MFLLHSIHLLISQYIRLVLKLRLLQIQIPWSFTYHLKDTLWKSEIVNITVVKVPAVIKVINFERLFSVFKTSFDTASHITIDAIAIIDSIPVDIFYPPQDFFRFFSTILYDFVRHLVSKSKN